MKEELNVIKNEKDTLEIEIINGEEGLGELISLYLNEQKDVEFGAYKKEHPLDKKIKIIIKSKKDPKKILLSVLDRIKGEIEEVNKLVKKV